MFLLKTAHFFGDFGCNEHGSKFVYVIALEYASLYNPILC